MKLKEYNEKRDFNKTNEPVGEISKSKKELKFVIQYHQARAKHYDFRLEWEGTLISFAVPKNLSKNPKVKRLAVKVEDHPLSYITFEGVIPKGQYGGGTVKIWDSGIYLPINNLTTGIKKGKIQVVLMGEKLQGMWNLIRIKDNNWLAIKDKEKIILKKNKQFLKKEKLPFKKIDVKLALLSKQIPTGQDWLFEIKYDGYRIVAFVEVDKVKLVSRNNNDYSKKFVYVCESLISVANGMSFVLDGEMVFFNKEGKTDFGALRDNIKEGGKKAKYVVFDILALGKQDLREKTLNVRKNFLKKIMKNCPGNIILSDYVVGNGQKCFDFAKKNKLEGVIAKKINSKYDGSRNEDWLKIKCYKRQEFVVVGYKTTEKNKNLSAILLGYYDGNKLVYAGKVGTGFTNEQRKDLQKLFNKNKSNNCLASGDNLPKKEKIIWLKPKILAEIQFAEITKDNNIRQGSFVGLRTDKNAKDVVLEVAK